MQYACQLKAGKPAEVYDVTVAEMVTAAVDAASARNGASGLRSGIFFGIRTFNGGLAVAGDHHAMIRFGGGCSFGEACAGCRFPGGV